MKKISYKIIALVQAFLVASYAWFAAFVMTIGEKGSMSAWHPVVAGTFVLVFFILSALVSSSLVFAYPIKLFMDGKMREAVKIVLWTAFWLIILFLIFLVSLIFLAV